MCVETIVRLEETLLEVGSAFEFKKEGGATGCACVTASTAGKGKGRDGACERVVERTKTSLFRFKGPHCFALLLLFKLSISLISVNFKAGNSWLDVVTWFRPPYLFWWASSGL